MSAPALSPLAALLNDAAREDEIFELPGRLGRVGREPGEPPQRARMVQPSQHELVDVEIDARKALRDRLKAKGIDDGFLGSPSGSALQQLYTNCATLAAAVRTFDDVDIRFGQLHDYMRLTIAERDALLEQYQRTAEHLSPLTRLKTLDELNAAVIALGEAGGEVETLLSSYDSASLRSITLAMVDRLRELQSENSSLSALLNVPSPSSTDSSTTGG